MVLLRAICAYECSNDKETFCWQHGLRHKGIDEVRKLRRQLTNIGMHHHFVDVRNFLSCIVIRVVLFVL